MSAGVAIWAGRIGKESVAVYLSLLRILVPALVIVKALELTGLTRVIGHVLAPLMASIGLPDGASIVWAATMLVNLYTGMAVFVGLITSEPMTVAQVTVLGSLMVVCHSLPVEGSVARAAGVPLWFTFVLRAGAAWLFGWVLHVTFAAGGWFEQPVVPAWQPRAGDASLWQWGVDQLVTLALTYAIILALMVVLETLRALGVEALIHALLRPVLRLIGIGPDAANITVIGITLGLTFGAGLLIRDIRAGTLSRRDAMLTVCFLGLCHSLIEDTILVMLLGASPVGVLWARLVMALLVIGALARLPPAAGFK